MFALLLNSSSPQSINQPPRPLRYYQAHVVVVVVLLLPTLGSFRMLLPRPTSPTSFMPSHLLWPPWSRLYQKPYLLPWDIHLFSPIIYIFQITFPLLYGLLPFSPFILCAFCVLCVLCAGSLQGFHYLARVDCVDLSPMYCNPLCYQSSVSTFE
jgi:hypothetical protein